MLTYTLMIDGCPDARGASYAELFSAIADLGRMTGYHSGYSTIIYRRGWTLGEWIAAGSSWYVKESALSWAWSRVYQDMPMADEAARADWIDRIPVDYTFDYLRDRMGSMLTAVASGRQEPHFDRDTGRITARSVRVRSLPEGWTVGGPTLGACPCLSVWAGWTLADFVSRFLVSGIEDQPRWDALRARLDLDDPKWAIYPALFSGRGLDWVTEDEWPGYGGRSGGVDDLSGLYADSAQRENVKLIVFAPGTGDSVTVTMSLCVSPWTLANMTMCDGCESYSSDINRCSDGSELCDDCRDEQGYTGYCDHCDQYQLDSDYLTEVNGYQICGPCLELDYTTCDECGSYVLSDEIETTRGRELCEDCAAEADREYIGGRVGSYHKTYAHRHYLSDGSSVSCNQAQADGLLSLGVELELEVTGYEEDRDALAGSIQDGAAAADLDDDFLEYKEDSSLDNGVEIVTQPAALAYHTRPGGWLDIVIDTAAASGGVRSHDGGHCGLHVHLSRYGLGDTAAARDDTQGRLYLLITRFWRSNLIGFSRRKEFGYCAHDDDASTFDGVDDVGGLDLLCKDQSKKGGHFRAVNASNDMTIELRFCRGSLVRQTLAASLALCDGLARYARDKTLADCLGVSWFGLIEWIDCPDLIEYDALRRSRGVYRPELTLSGDDILPLY